MWNTIKETRENLIADYCQSHMVDIIPLKNLQCGNNVHDTPEYEKKNRRLERIQDPDYPQTNEKDKKLCSYH